VIPEPYYIRRRWFHSIVDRVHLRTWCVAGRELGGWTLARLGVAYLVAGVALVFVSPLAAAWAFHCATWPIGRSRGPRRVP
jgi:hypothetical protein